MYFLAFYLRGLSDSLPNMYTVAFFILFFAQAVINFKSIKLIAFNKFLFILSEIIIIVISGILITPGETVLYMSMLPVIGVQIISLYDIRLKTLLFILAPAQILVMFIQLIGNGFFLAFMALEASVFLNTIIFLAWRSYHRQVSQMIKTKHLLEELQLTYTEVKEISQQNERSRIGRDLHDTLMQGLAGVTMQLEGIKALLLNNKLDRAIQEIDKTINLSRNSLKEARAVVYDMRTNSVIDGDLYDRLNQLGKVFYENYGLNVNIKTSTEIKLPHDYLEEILKIISESLTNIVKHAKTDVAIVKISFQNYLAIEIVDYGVGFNVSNGERKENHFGLNAIYERVEMLNGQVKIDSHIGEGTKVNISFPAKLRWQNDK
ncbi:histidine kinase [Leuconostoc litchii]|nr:histidine kinase [Leuconostoc litchii]